MPLNYQPHNLIARLMLGRRIVDHVHVMDASFGGACRQANGWTQQLTEV